MVSNTKAEFSIGYKLLKRILRFHFPVKSSSKTPCYMVMILPIIQWHHLWFHHYSMLGKYYFFLS